MFIKVQSLNIIHSSSFFFVVKLIVQSSRGHVYYLISGKAICDHLLNMILQAINNVEIKVILLY